MQKNKNKNTPTHHPKGASRSQAIRRRALHRGLPNLTKFTPGLLPTLGFCFLNKRMPAIAMQTFVCSFAAIQFGETEGRRGAAPVTQRRNSFSFKVCFYLSIPILHALCSRAPLLPPLFLPPPPSQLTYHVFAAELAIPEIWPLLTRCQCSFLGAASQETIQSLGRLQSPPPPPKK